MFVPLYVMYPAADVPVLQLSLRSNFSPREHLAVGRALAPLRDEGVLILGSGLPSYHNIPKMQSTAAGPDSREFEAWLTNVCVGNSGEARSKLLEQWEQAPSARAAHPSEDHFMPLLVAVGAAEDEPGVRHHFSKNAFGSVTESSYRFGASSEST